MTEPGKPSPLPDCYVRTRRPEEGRYKNSGWVSALFITLALIGWAFPWHEDPPPIRDCSAVETTKYPAARETLIGQGYQPTRDGRLVPPGCEP